MVVEVGLGSVLFHGFRASNWLLMMDWLPAMLVSLSVTVYFWVKVLPSFIAKNKIELTPEIDAEHLLNKLQQVYANEELNTEDGLKIIFGREWVHIRKSNTEPIIRIYAEAETEAQAVKIFEQVKKVISSQYSVFSSKYASSQLLKY